MKIKTLTLMTMVLSMGLLGCDKAPEPKKADTTKAASTTTTTTTATTETSKLPANAPTYTMAVDATYAPFAFKDEKGNVTGFDDDIIRAIGEDQGFKVAVISVPWDGIFESLNAGTKDIVGSGIVVTPERQQNMNLSDAYLTSHKSAAYLSSKMTIGHFDELKNKTIGVQGDTAFSKTLTDYYGDKKDNVKSYTTSFLAFKDMLTGKVDATFNNSNIIDYYIKNAGQQINAGEIKTINFEGQPDQLAFALKKGRTDLTDKINTGLKHIKANGTYDKIYQKWFGKLPDAATTTTTTVSSSVATTK